MCNLRLSSTVALVFAGLFLGSLAVCGTLALDSVSLESRRVMGASLLVITADLNDPRLAVDIGVPEKGIGYSASFLAIVNRHSPIAAVTGTYFDVGTSVPVGTIVIGGKTVHTSCIGSAVCFYRPNRVEIQGMREGEDCDFPGVECGLRTGPRLLAGGEYALSPRREGFRDRSLFGARTRIALGITSQNKLLMVALRTPVTFSRLASVMKLLGAWDAVCLDGGTSSAMYYKGRVLRWPGRRLTNIIEVREISVPAPTYPTPALVSAPAPSVNIEPPTGIEPTGGPGISAPADVFDIIRQSPNPASPVDVSQEQQPVLPGQIQLSLSEGLLTFGPVNRAKLARLKGLNHSEHFAYVPAHA